MGRALCAPSSCNGRVKGRDHATVELVSHHILAFKLLLTLWMLQLHCRERG